MADTSAIEWTDSTFNPWRGCSAVSPGCDFCYAETLAKRNPAALGEWGKDAARVIAAEAYWQKPAKWNRDALADGRRRRVFCASLADVFEDRPDLDMPRLRLLSIIRETPALDWLLLTKRPKSILPLLRRAREKTAAALAQFSHDARVTGRGKMLDLVTKHRDEIGVLDAWLADWLAGVGPANVFLGTSAEDQERAEQRLPALLRVPAAGHFVSAEPLLGPLDLSPWLHESTCATNGRCAYCDPLDGEPKEDRLAWVIVGGESGPHARPMHRNWAGSIRDACTSAGVPFLFKQWGEFAPSWTVAPGDVRPDGTVFVALDGSVHALTETDRPASGWSGMNRCGKKAAGRTLDGATHDGFPIAFSRPAR